VPPGVARVPIDRPGRAATSERPSALRRPPVSDGIDADPGGRRGPAAPLAGSLPDSRPERAIAGAWRQRAACGGAGPALFFPVGETGVAVEESAAALAVCRGCPVAADCLEYALATNQRCGIWGGATEDDRRQLRRTWLARQQAMLVHPSRPPEGASNDAPTERRLAVAHPHNVPAPGGRHGA